MANQANKRPMIIDSTGDVLKSGTLWGFIGVNVKPSAGNCAVILTDGDGNIIYQAAKTSADSFTESWQSNTVNGLIVDTLTNITRIMILRDV